MVDALAANRFPEPEEVLALLTGLSAGAGLIVAAATALVVRLGTKDTSAALLCAAACFVGIPAMTASMLVVVWALS